MKTLFLKATGFSLVAGMILSTGVFAQNNPNTGTTPSTNQAGVKPGTPATYHEETKDEWLKHYNEMKPKLDALSAKAKTESNNPDFTIEVTKLNRMEGAFKSKLDNWDKITPDKRESYNKDLRASHKAFYDQYQKTKQMYDKMHPGEKTESEKGTPKN